MSRVCTVRVYDPDPACSVAENLCLSMEAIGFYLHDTEIEAVHPVWVEDWEFRCIDGALALSAFADVLGPANQLLDGSSLTSTG